MARFVLSSQLIAQEILRLAEHEIPAAARRSFGGASMQILPGDLEMAFEAFAERIAKPIVCVLKQSMREFKLGELVPDIFDVTVIDRGNACHVALKRGVTGDEELIVCYTVAACRVAEKWEWA
jgi:hypothetical protein